jgi:hypothetical protein
VLWGISQNAHVSGLGMDGGDRTMFIPVFIVDARNISASEGILKAQMIPSDKKLSSTQIQQLCNKSEIGRAIFFGGNNQWYPMPKLENYSGFDRDNRKFLDGFAPPPKGDKLVNDYDAISRLEDSFKSELQNSLASEDKIGKQLSDNAKLVLSLFDNATKKVAKSTKDLKDANKLRQLSDSELLLALRELVVSQNITFDSEGKYLKPEWQ